MKKSILPLLILFSFTVAHANDHLRKDTLYTELKNDIVILSSVKETNSLKSLPAAVSVFSPKNLEALQVHSLKDLSSFVPNYFVADYGSRMTAPVYIRGIGARSGAQTVSMYVDNIAYFNTTSFDIELFDIQRIEVLRGTQGTLYGRNAMGGILNVYTLSPLSYEGTMLRVGGGSYGQLSAHVSNYKRLNNDMGISVSGYYKQDNGFFKNLYTGNKVDDIKNGGGRAKFVWNITPRLLANYSLSLDFVDQGAFPYEDVDTREINYNSEGYYKRNLITNGLSLKYSGIGYEVNSTTGYQFLKDEMNMDQDYTPLSIFQINQRQNQNSWSQEITIKSNNQSKYQWSNGVYGFHDNLRTTPPVYMMEDGIRMILQSQMDALKIQFPNMPAITFTDSQIDLKGVYKSPTYGAAVFHQSTFNDLGVKGLSMTLGLRLDYEKTKLDYNASTKANFTVGNYPGSFPADTAIIGNVSDDFLELLPKALFKYQINPQSFIYASASRGYKTGGHNIQIFADLLQEALEAKMMSYIPGMGGRPNDEPSLEDRISFKPEYSWNYELGGQIDIIDNTLSTNFAAYYIDVQNVQITKFIRSGGGRMVANAGEATSKGFELGLKARPCDGFYLYANYGFSDARFKDYENGAGEDFSNNYIPFAPRSTFSVGGTITRNVKNSSLLDRVTLDSNFAGIGRIYWNEANDMSQGFYGTLDARVAFEKNILTLEFWGKNLLDRDYHTFLFESMNNFFGQRGKPMRWGASLKIKL